MRIHHIIRTSPAPEERGSNGVMVLRGSLVWTIPALEAEEWDGAKIGQLKRGGFICATKSYDACFVPHTQFSYSSVMSRGHMIGSSLSTDGGTLVT
eukprot:2903881-Pyramimonas_sp.AAC.3